MSENDWAAPDPAARPGGYEARQPSPGWQQAPVPQQPWVQPAPAPSSPGTNGLAIASLVLGIVWIYWIGSILALVFGYVAKNQIRRTGEGGSGMATAGIVLGWVGVGILAIVILAVLVAAGSDSGY